MQKQNKIYVNSMSNFYVESYSDEELRYGFITLTSLFTDYYTRIPVKEAVRILTATRGNDIKELRLFKYTVTTVIRQIIVDWNYGFKFSPLDVISPTHYTINKDELEALPSNYVEFNIFDIINGRHFLDHLAEALERIITAFDKTKDFAFNRDIKYLTDLRAVLGQFRAISEDDHNSFEYITDGILFLLRLHPYKFPLLTPISDYIVCQKISSELHFNSYASSYFLDLKTITVDNDGITGVM